MATSPDRCHSLVALARWFLRRLVDDDDYVFGDVLGCWRLGWGVEVLFCFTLWMISETNTLYMNAAANITPLPLFNLQSPQLLSSRLPQNDYVPKNSILPIIRQPSRFWTSIRFCVPNAINYPPLIFSSIIFSVAFYGILPFFQSRVSQYSKSYTDNKWNEPWCNYILIATCLL